MERTVPQTFVLVFLCFSHPWNTTGRVRAKVVLNNRLFLILLRWRAKFCSLDWTTVHLPDSFSLLWYHPCSSLEEGGPPSNQAQQCWLVKWYRQFLLTFPIRVWKWGSGRNKGSEDLNAVEISVKMLLFVLIQPFQISHLSVWREGKGEEKDNGITYIPYWWRTPDTSEKNVAFCMFHIV